MKVLEKDPRCATALGFLGMVYHMLDDLDQAILYYHEALSVDPLNQHLLDLLNLALETNVIEGMPLSATSGGEELWQQMVTEKREGKQALPGLDPGAPLVDIEEEGAHLSGSMAEEMMMDVSYN